MAKVIGQDEEVSRKVSCRGCGARIAYYRNDTSHYTSSDYGGGSDTYWSITCPKCGKSISVGPWYE